MFSWMLATHRAVPSVSHGPHCSTRDSKKTHQDRIPMMMTMKIGLSGLFLVVLLASSVSGLGSVVLKDYLHIQSHFTWQEAQSYCRSSYYTDLATIYTQSDTEHLYLEQYFAWIDLYRPANISMQSRFGWYMGTEQYNIFNTWGQNEPGNGESCASIHYRSHRFYGANCEEYFFFICHEHRLSHILYTFIPQSKTWLEAQQYCKSEFHDLATLEQGSPVNQQDFPVWTGLHRDGETWKWSTGVSKYRKWAPGEPGNNGDCVSISSLSKKMTTQNCSARFPFICFRDNLILVKENKTWEEALEHCRALKPPYQSHIRYELVSVQPGEDHNYLVGKVMEANTKKVWVGLRFLAGHWLWVNGANMLYPDQPLCPLMGQHCGALSKNDTGHLETTDCLEKWNFLCYSTTY